MQLSIGKYVASLLPSFEKGQVEEDLRVLKEELSENTLPPYEAAADFFKHERFASKDNEEFDRTFTRQAKNVQVVMDKYPVTICAALTRALDTVNMLETKVDDLFNRDVASDGLTYSRANMLRLIEVIGFAARYARKLLLWTYANEKQAMGKTVSDPFTKAEIDWLKANRQAFFASIITISRKSKDVETALANIPNMVVVPNEVSVAAQTVGPNKLDPLQMGIIPIQLNPIYHIRMAVAEYQAGRYKAGQEEKRALEYRLVALKELKEGKHDAKLDQNIEYTENRLKKLNAKLAKMEED